MGRVHQLHRVHRAPRLSFILLGGAIGVIGFLLVVNGLLYIMGGFDVAWRALRTFFVIRETIMLFIVVPALIVASLILALELRGLARIGAVGTLLAAVVIGGTSIIEILLATRLIMYTFSLQSLLTSREAVRVLQVVIFATYLVFFGGIVLLIIGTLGLKLRAVVLSLLSILAVLTPVLALMLRLMISGEAGIRVQGASMVLSGFIVIAVAVGVASIGLHGDTGE